MMAGLLNVTEDPATLGLLSLGLRLMSTPGNFGQALGHAGLGALGDVQTAQQLAMRNELGRSQIEENKQQAELRKQQAQRLSEMQRMLSDVLGSSPNQYGVAGNGITLGGVREPMTPKQGGLAGATPEQIAALKAAGVDVSNLWELAKFGKEMQPGYRRNADNSIDYFGDPTKGIGFDPRTNQVSVLPGAAEAQAKLAGATKAAESAATAPWTPGPCCVVSTPCH